MRTLQYVVREYFAPLVWLWRMVCGKSGWRQEPTGSVGKPASQPHPTTCPKCGHRAHRGFPSNCWECDGLCDEGPWGHE